MMTPVVGYWFETGESGEASQGKTNKKIEAFQEI